jgi:hypothetical protein
MGRPPRPIKRINVTVRFEPWEIEAIDAQRGERTRQAWIHNAAVSFANDMKHGDRPGKLAPVEVQFHMRNIRGDGEKPLRLPRAKPGERLKR